MVCLAFIFYHILTIRYIEVNFKLALVDCVRYNEDFIKSWFCSIHFTVIWAAGLKKKVRYTEDFVKSRFHCPQSKFRMLNAICRASNLPAREK